MRITTENTASVLIDVQEKLIPHMVGYVGLIDRLTVLMKGLNVLEVPIILSEQYKKGLGETIPELTSNVLFKASFEKRSFSCVGNHIFDNYLESNQIKNVILFGIESHVCVLQTAIDLKESGYNPIVVWDAVSSRFDRDKSIALERLKQEGVLITTTESLLLELCQSSEHIAFKAISQLIR